MKESSKGWSGILPYLFVVLAGLAAFFPTLRVGFLWDDHIMIEENPAIQHITRYNLHHIFTHDIFEGLGNDYYRPLQALSNMLDYQIWGLNPFGFHLTNLCFHILNACLLFLLFKKFAPERVSLWATLFFVVHPVVIEQLLIIAGRAEIMSFTFILLMILFALRRTTIGTLLSLLFFLAGCFFKESGAVAPLFLLILGWTYPDLRVPKRNYLGYAILFLVYLYLRKPVSATLIATPHNLGSFVIEKLPTILVGYINVILFPTDLHSHRTMMFQLLWQVLNPLLILLFLLSAWLKKSRLIWLGILWWGAGLLPKLPILATNGLMLDHWGYLGSPGIHLIMAYLIFIDIGKKGWGKVGGILIAVFLILAWVGLDWWNWFNRNTDKKMYLWALKYPTSPHVHYNLGRIYYQEGDYPKACLLFEEADRMDPRGALNLNGLAVSLWRLGEKDKALQLLNQAIRYHPDFAPSYYHRALIERGGAGLKDLETALVLNPEFGEAKKLETILKEEINRGPRKNDAHLR